MRSGPVFKLLLALLAATLAAGARPALARDGPPCHAAAQLGESYAAVAASPARWSCRTGEVDHRPETTFVRFGLSGSGALPASFVSRIGRFSALELTAIDRDGAQRSRRFAMADARMLTNGPYFALPLPAVSERTAAVVVRIDRPWARNILAEAHLSARPGGDGWGAGSVAALAAICGLLAAPLLFNLAFYRVLRERFVLWHFGVVAGMLGQAAIGSGLIHLVVALPMALVVPLMSACFSFAVAGAALFTADFIEPGKLSPRTQRVLRTVALPSFAIGFICSLTLAPLRLVAMDLYYLTLLPMSLLLIWAMGQALSRGSRMVWFQVIGWAPSIGIGLWRIFTNVSHGIEPADAVLAYNAALAFEVVVTALGVATRFLSLRRERDLARLTARQMQGEAERDPLTGLYNRRGIEPRYAALRAAGFSAVAVIDLDRFKRVNDTCGHHVGDQVLAATAVALQPDADTIAIRLGGEEFVLLLRGRDAAARAEARRRAVTQRVAALVAELPLPVTASMGLIEFPLGGQREISFHEAYTRADRLLYEAKRSGRNRAVSERMILFDRRPNPREAAA
ncbi:MAG: sensor domain-containing diguanylate cyclase [Novosphingobium sp.]